MSFFVFPPVTLSFKFCAFPGWDGWLRSMLIKIINQLVAIIPSICQYIASIQIYMLQQRNRKINIVALSFADHDKNGIPIGIYCRMDFGAGSSTAMSDFIRRPPFLAPALC